MGNDQSRYCYPGTDVLINYADLRSQKQLDEFEAIVTKKRLMDLYFQPTRGRFDLAHLQEIHRYVFQDVYPFAGELRTETIGKDFFSFPPHQFIRTSAADLFRKLSGENFLKGLQLEQFAPRAAYYMAEINASHPFREGNGRTQREFIRQVAEKAGYHLDWSKVDKSRIMRASIRSKVDTQELTQVITESLRKKVKPPLLKDLLKQVDGIPSIHNSYLPDHRDLNRLVMRYCVRPGKDGTILDFQLQGDQVIKTLQMDRPADLSQEMKDRWIEQAAKNVKSLRSQKGLEL